MIERDRRMNAEVIGCIITRVSELNKNDLSSDNDSMAGLQHQAKEDYPETMTLTHMVMMESIMTENIGDIRHKL